MERGFDSPSISASEGDGVAVEGWTISWTVPIGNLPTTPLRLLVSGLLIKAQARRNIEEKYLGTAG